MTKIVAVLLNAPAVLSGSYSSKLPIYKEFLKNYKNSKIDFGNMNRDRENYSSDISNVAKDLRYSAIKYKKLKVIG